jgi:SagB-type dehydrogenase family enzyme
MISKLNRREFLALSATALVSLGVGSALSCGGRRQDLISTGVERGIIKLPNPVLTGELSVESAMATRRSVRDYQPLFLDQAEIGQLLWAAQGVTHPDGYRTAPSAGALYPLDVYILAGQVNELSSGVYMYSPDSHELVLYSEGDKRQALCNAALDQAAVKDAPAVIVLCGVYERTTKKYGSRGERYVHMEVGFAAQNVYLQAEALGLGVVFIGAFYEDQVRSVLDLAHEEAPLGIIPVGRV